jgi:predicted RNA-binding protein with RPS1 domain
MLIAISVVNRLEKRVDIIGGFIQLVSDLLDEGHKISIRVIVVERFPIIGLSIIMPMHVVIHKTTQITNHFTNLPMI